MSEGQEPGTPDSPEAVEMVPLLDEEGRNKLPLWAWILFGVAAIVLIGLVWFAIANSTDAENAPITEPTPSDSPTPMPSPTFSDSPTPMPSPTFSDSPTPMPSPTFSDSPTPMPSPTGPTSPPATFTDGSFVGGTDVLAGTYRTTAAVTGGKCVWILAGTGASDGAVIPPIGTPPGGIPTVTLPTGYTLATKGCGTWITVDPTLLFANGAAKAVLTDGVWLVGEEVRPGTYTTQTIPPGTIPEKLCRWTVSKDVASNFSEIVVRSFVTEGAGKVTLTEGEQIESTNCGDWIALTK